MPRLKDMPTSQCEATATPAAARARFAVANITPRAAFVSAVPLVARRAHTSAMFGFAFTLVAFAVTVTGCRASAAPVAARGPLTSPHSTDATVLNAPRANPQARALHDADAAGTARAPTSNYLSPEERAARLTAFAEDEAAAAAWPTLGINGRNWEHVLRALPVDPNVRVPLARALLQGGNFACSPVTSTMACSARPVAFAATKPDATIDDPCLRRLLVPWALDELPPEKAAAEALFAPLLALTRLPPPEVDLHREVLTYLLDSQAPEAMLMQALVSLGQGQHAAAGQGNATEWERALAVPMETVPVALLERALQQGVDLALLFLSLESAPDAFIAAAINPGLLVRTRVEAISQLADSDAAREPALARTVRKALLRLVDDSVCEIAAAARLALGPTAPAVQWWRDPRRALCLAQHGALDLAQLMAKQVTVVRVDHVVDSASPERAQATAKSELDWFTSLDLALAAAAHAPSADGVPGADGVDAQPLVASAMTLTNLAVTTLAGDAGALRDVLPTQTQPCSLVGQSVWCGDAEGIVEYRFRGVGPSMRLMRVAQVNTLQGCDLQAHLLRSKRKP